MAPTKNFMLLNVRYSTRRWRATCSAGIGRDRSWKRVTCRAYRRCERLQGTDDFLQFLKLLFDENLNFGQCVESRAPVKRRSTDPLSLGTTVIHYPSRSECAFGSSEIGEGSLQSNILKARVRESVCERCPLYISET